MNLVGPEYYGGAIWVFLGIGDCTFRHEVGFDFSDSGYPASPVVGDFNDDGRLDLAVARYSIVGVYLGNG